MKIVLTQQPVELTDGEGNTLATIDLVEFEMFVEKIEREPLPDAEDPSMTPERLAAITDWIKGKTDDKVALTPAQSFTLAMEGRQAYIAFKKKLNERLRCLATTELPLTS